MDPAPTRVERALAGWKGELLDLSADNPLIHFRAGKHGVVLVQPTPAALYELLTDRVEPASLRMVATAPPTATELVVVRASDSAAPSGEAVGPLLRKLRERAREARLEQGVQLLYLGLGLLEWEIHDGAEVRPVRSPLALIPVRLDRPSALDDYRLVVPPDQEPEPLLNPTLARRLKQEIDLDLTLWPDEAPPMRLAELFEAAREAVAAQPAWRVVEEVVLGLFPFVKFSLYQDLERTEERLLAHPVVRAIAGEEDGVGPRRQTPTAAQLDAGERPATLFQVLDADASQREVLAAVAAGLSAVVQGPPGTGKSQTIANLIAEALGNDRSVLFVSEKVAALRVVADRLDAVGLGAYCLALHTDEVDKPGVVRRLADAAGLGAPRPNALRTTADDPAAVLRRERLVAGRRRLNDYLRALTDADNPRQVSAFDVIGELALLTDAELIPFDVAPARTGDLTPDLLARWEALIDDLAELADIAVAPDRQRWADLNPRLLPPDEATRNRLRERLETLDGAAFDLAIRQDRLRAGLGLPAAASLRDARRLGALCAELGPQSWQPALESWFSPDGFAETRRIATERHEAAQATPPRPSARDRLRDDYRPAILDRTLLTALDRALHAGEWRLLIPEGEEDDLPPFEEGGEGAVRVLGGILLAHLAELGAATRRAVAALETPEPVDLAQTRALLRLLALVAAKRPPLRDWFDPTRRAALRELAAEGSRHGSARSSSLSRTTT